MTNVAPAACPPEQSKPIEYFNSDRICDIDGLPVEQKQARAAKRAKLREVVPSGTWYRNATEDKGVKFPVKGMVESKALTWFPTEPGRGTSRASTRYMSHFCDEDRFDLLEYWDMEAVRRLPPSWSARLVAGMRPRYEYDTRRPWRREPIIRRVRLGLMARVEWFERRTVGNRRRTTVRVRFPDPKTGERTAMKEALRQLWPIDDVPLRHWPEE